MTRREERERMELLRKAGLLRSRPDVPSQQLAERYERRARSIQYRIAGRYLDRLDSGDRDANHPNVHRISNPVASAILNASDGEAAALVRAWIEDKKKAGTTVAPVTPATSPR